MEGNFPFHPKIARVTGRTLQKLPDSGKIFHKTDNPALSDVHFTRNLVPVSETGQ